MCYIAASNVTLSSSGVVTDKCFILVWQYQCRCFGRDYCQVVLLGLSALLVWCFFPSMQRIQLNSERVAETWKFVCVSSQKCRGHKWTHQLDSILYTTYFDFWVSLEQCVTKVVQGLTWYVSFGCVWNMGGWFMSAQYLSLLAFA